MEEAFKKVVVATIDTRKFVEALLYLGSIGGKLTKNCVAFKGAIIRAEVELPEATPVTESQILKLSTKPVERRVNTEVLEEDKKAPSKRGRKKAEDIPESGEVVSQE